MVHSTPRFALTMLAGLCVLPAPATGQPLQLPVRGTRTAGLWVTSATQTTLTIRKRDINIYAGADVLSYEVGDAAGASLAQGSVPDNGVTTAGGGAGKLQSQTVKLKLATGYHQLRLTSPNSDAVYDVDAAGARLQWMGGQQ